MTGTSALVEPMWRTWWPTQAGIRKGLQRGGLFAARWSGLAAVISRSMKQCGAILMFHEVEAGRRPELANPTAARLLDDALLWLRRSGWDIVSLDEALTRLGGAGPARRFAVLTFDDGYRDLVSNALPILERHRAPFIVYIPTGAITRELYSWWLGLREVVARTDRLTIDAMNREFDCSTLRSKRHAVDRVEGWVSRDYRRAELLRPLLASSGVSLERLNERYFLGEGEVRSLARNPLATIGGHTTSHPALATLEREAARLEMSGNRSYLEELVQRPVRHFANPHGDPAACGPREAMLAAACGFASAVTTQHGHLRDDPLCNPYMLPRIGFDGTDSRTTFVAKISGVKTAALRTLARRGI